MAEKGYTREFEFLLYLIRNGKIVTKTEPDLSILSIKLEVQCYLVAIAGGSFIDLNKCYPVHISPSWCNAWITV